MPTVKETEDGRPFYDVVIATPGSVIHRKYIKSLMETVAWLQEQRMSWVWLNEASSFVSDAREKTALNKTVNDWQTNEIGCGEFDYDRMVWIDSDVEWKVSDFDRLIGHDLDIVSGMVPSSTDGRITATNFNEHGHPGMINALDYLLEGDPLLVDAVGFGFLCVRKGVFEKMPRPWFKIREVRIAGAGFPVNLGEDYSWCESATSVGFQVWLDPLVKVDHWKEFSIHI